ncbi:cytochrome P450 [Actinospica durhamensis]|uniref:Cytochrome P450 n=1 Tax=Actinospica durhamensis TaxID=1508375 RepID=A0A941IV83_9ACTN|nr:cytochrome P450 [Actinospica durhamensis]MBR7838768.1 cytochrome P450 [Actinospica durhamensis]
MAAKEHRFSRYADVVAALAEPALVPIPPRARAAATPPGAADTLEPADRPGTAAWLRATVARFASGPTHQRRRGLVEADLDRLDPAGLRLAATRAAAAAAHTGGAPGDARLLAVRVLADALGLPDPDAVAADVLLVAGVYFGGDEEAADAAVARLMAVLLSADEPLLPGIEGHEHDMWRTGRADGRAARAVGEDGDEPGADADGRVAAARLEAAANRIGLLVQACDATGTLVDHARRAMRAQAGNPEVEAVLAETLRHDPPVRTMRRVALRPVQVGGVALAAGDAVTLDIAAANRDPEVFTRPDTFDLERTMPALTFGADPRRCPGRRHAFALAAGILDHVGNLEAARGHGPAELDEAA